MGLRRFEVVDAPQRSDLWFAARLGLLTSSNANAVVNGFRKDKKPTAERRDCLTGLAVERLTGRSAKDPFTCGDMNRGTGLEPQARIAYEFATGMSAREVGFLRSTLHMAGCSPDAVIGDFEGLAEIKAPRSTTHLGYMSDAGVPEDYRPQMVHQMWISGVGWVDFVSFDPLMPEPLQLFVVRLERDEKEIAEYERKALAFLAEIETKVAALLTVTNVGSVLKAAAEVV